MCVYIYIYVYTHMYMYIHIYIYIYVYDSFLELSACAVLCHRWPILLNSALAVAARRTLRGRVVPSLCDATWNTPNIYIYIYIHTTI